MNLLYILAYLIAINLAAYICFYLDKNAARRGDWRIPESTLLGLALFGGSAGAIYGQRTLRHKTRKQPFKSQLYGIVVLQIMFLLALLVPDFRALVIEQVKQTLG